VFDGVLSVVDDDSGMHVVPPGSDKVDNTSTPPLKDVNAAPATPLKDVADTPPLRDANAAAAQGINDKSKCVPLILSIFLNNVWF
jgi:hypothetical protein